MSKPSLLSIAGCYSFYIDNQDVLLQDICKYALDNRIGCLIISEYDDLPFSNVSACVILYGTHLRKAFEVYHQFHGSNIRNIEEVFVQSILGSIGDYSGKAGRSYILNVKTILKKGE